MHHNHAIVACMFANFYSDENECVCCSRAVLFSCVRKSCRCFCESLVKIPIEIFSAEALGSLELSLARSDELTIRGREPNPVRRRLELCGPILIVVVAAFCLASLEIKKNNLRLQGRGWGVWVAGIC